MSFASPGRAVRALPLFSLACALLPSHHALAQTPPIDTTPSLQTVNVVDAASTPNGKLQLDTPVETGSRLGLTARETPASVTVVDRATIDARGAQDTQEILRAIPGVTAHNAPGSMAASYRGFTGNAVTQLYNGITVHYGSATRAVDSWIYDRVEAIGGASSFLYGSGAVGGSLNYITKTAERSDFTEAQLRLGSYDLKEASVGLNRRLAGTSGGSGPAHFARLDLNHRDAGSWTQGTHTRSTQLATSLLSDLGGGITHLLAYEYQTDQWIAPTGARRCSTPPGARSASTKARASRTTTAPTACTHNACSGCARWRSGVCPTHCSCATPFTCTTPCATTAT